jgi:hypothetical protein
MPSQVHSFGSLKQFYPIPPSQQGSQRSPQEKITRLTNKSYRSRGSEFQKNSRGHSEEPGGPTNNYGDGSVHTIGPAAKSI